MVEKVSGLFIITVVWSSGALGRAGPFPLHHHRLLVFSDGTGHADGCWAQIRVVFVCLNVFAFLREKKI